MIGGKRVLGLVPARGGSKGLPGKNLRSVAGKPLLAYTIETARLSEYIDRIVVSSEDAQILDVAASFGAEILKRPAHLAQDDTPGVAPALHALEALPGFDILVLLQPSSPLRQASDIDGCVERCLAAGGTCCVSVVPASESPYWMFTLTPTQALQPLLAAAGDLIARRQDLPPAYLLNGAVYAAGRDWLRRERAFVRPGVRAWVMPAERSLDIDVQADLDHFSNIVLQGRS